LEMDLTDFTKSPCGECPAVPCCFENPCGLTDLVAAYGFVASRSFPAVPGDPGCSVGLAWGWRGGITSLRSPRAS
jgi:hypothetical protein